MTNFSIAILGGGFYGFLAAQKLAALKTDHTLSISLFTLHEYATMLPATVRLVTGGFKAKDVTVEYSKVLDEKVDLKIVKEITEFDDKSVTYVLKNSAELKTEKFDIIIIATGLTWYDPIQFSSIEDPSVSGLDSYNLVFQKKVSAAKKIVIAGGGDVGCELAGELGFTFKDDIAKSKKEVYLVHPNDNLLDDRILKKVRNNLHNQLKKAGIKIILNEKVDFEKSTDTHIVLSSGADIKDVDQSFKTVGPSPNLPQNDLNLTSAKGYVSINEHLQTKFPNVFAVGDIADLQTKSLLFKDETIDILIHNVIQQVEGKKNFKKYTKFIDLSQLRPVCVLSLGPEASAGQATVPLFGTISLPGFVTTKLKAKLLFTDHILEHFSPAKK